MPDPWPGLTAKSDSSTTSDWPGSLKGNSDSRSRSKSPLSLAGVARPLREAGRLPPGPPEPRLPKSVRFSSCVFTWSSTRTRTDGGDGGTYRSLPNRHQHDTRTKPAGPNLLRPKVVFGAAALRIYGRSKTPSPRDGNRRHLLQGERSEGARPLVSRTPRAPD